MKIPINKKIIKEKLFIIEGALSRLKQFRPYSLEAFKEGDCFAVADHHLRRALEALLEIGIHILSRIPGAKPASYSDIARLLGEHKIVPRDFAEKELTQMAKYRNRLIHFYDEIKPDELSSIIKNDLPNIEKFCQYIIKYIEKL